MNTRSTTGQTPLITIIIPYQNRRMMMDELLASIPDDPRLEVIIVDDHSDEPYVPGCRKAQALVTVLRAPDTQRYAGPARNLGLDVAQGEYVFFCDSDDLVDQAGFLTCLERLEAPNPPEVLYTFPTSFLHHTGGSGSRCATLAWALDEAQRRGDKAPLYRFHAPWAKFIRRSLIEKHAIRFSDTLVSNDVLFNAAMCKHLNDFEITRTVVYRVREGNDSLTTHIDPARILIRFKVQDAHNAALCDAGLSGMRTSAWKYIRPLLKLAPGLVPQIVRLSLAGHTPLFTPLATLRMRMSRKLYMTSRRRAISVVGATDTSAHADTTATRQK